jgi:hypothetical protein
MDFFGRGHQRDRGRKEQVLRNPIRLRILDLFTTDEARPLGAQLLTADLRHSMHVSVSQVAYYLACLRDAGLIPGGEVKGC